MPGTLRSWKELLLMRVVLESRLRAHAVGRHRESLDRDARIGTAAKGVMLERGWKANPGVSRTKA